MSGSGSENRARQITLKARFTEAEAALITSQAARAGVSVAALIRFSLLDQEPLRATRWPTLDQKDAAKLLAGLGNCAEALRQAASAGNPAVHGALVEAATQDISEMRALWFKAMGRKP
jgi:hypothetical protein